MYLETPYVSHFHPLRIFVRETRSLSSLPKDAYVATHTFISIFIAHEQSSQYSINHSQSQQSTALAFDLVHPVSTPTHFTVLSGDTLHPHSHRKRLISYHSQLLYCTRELLPRFRQLTYSHYVTHEETWHIDWSNPPDTGVEMLAVFGGMGLPECLQA